MKYAFSILLALSTLSVHAQVNIIDSVAITHFTPTCFAETPSSLFLIRAAYPGYAVATSTAWGYYAQAYKMVKVNKQTYAITASKVVMGDTLQADSFVIGGTNKFLIKDNRVHIFYGKCFSYSRFGLYYQQLDTNLNVVVPEEQLLLTAGNERFNRATYSDIALVGEKVFAAYRLLDTISNKGLTKYFLLDAQGNVLLHDTLPLKPFIDASDWKSHMVNQVSAYPGNKLLLSGAGIAGKQDKCGFVLTDSNLNVIDTFSLVPEHYRKAPLSDGWYYSVFPNSYYEYRMPSVAPLPSGSMIAGGLFAYKKTGPGLYYAHTAISKLERSKRFSIDTVLLFTGEDSWDFGHGTHSELKMIGYNAMDNLVYFSNMTHMLSDPSDECLPGISEYNNYIQVIAVDTNLQTRWRKFIRPGDNICANVVYVTPCINRSGIMVGGTFKTFTNPTIPVQQPYFLFRVDSSISTNGIHNPDHNGFTIRDRFVIYPNPATDVITIDDFLGQLAAVSITNMQGQEVYHQAASGHKVEVKLSPFPAGLYMVRVRSTDDEWSAQKVLKQ